MQERVTSQWESVVIKTVVTDLNEAHGSRYLEKSTDTMTTAYNSSRDCIQSNGEQRAKHRLNILFWATGGFGTTYRAWDDWC